MLYITEYGDTLCEDCAREYYYEELPGTYYDGISQRVSERR